MTTPKKTEPTPPGSEAQSSVPDRIPAAIQKVMKATAKDLWPKIRAFLIESEEEGELVELLPEMNHAMKACLPKLLKRVRKREITGDDLDQGYRQIHDAIHGVRQALYALFVLAGCKDPELKESTLEDPPPRTALPEEVPAGGEGPALAARTGKL